MASYCWNCGKPIKPGQRFCGKCGARLEEEEQFADAITEPAPALPEPNRPKANTFGILLIIIFTGIWFFAPLAALNRLGMDAQPTGLMLLELEDYELEQLMRSPVFWLELGSLLIMAVCLLASIFGDRKSTRGYALVSALCLAAILVCMYFWTDRDMEDLPAYFGWGYWTLLATSLLTAIVNIPSGK